MIAPPSRTRALVLATLLIVSTFAVVATPAIVSAQAGGEPNDTKENATRIDTNEFVDGEIDEAGGNRDVDWYRFDVAAGEHLRVISAEGYGVGSSYTLYGPGGTVLGSGDEYGTEDAPVAGTASATGGTYYLEVTTDDAFAGESYGFSVETVIRDTFEPNENRSDAVPVESGTTRSGVVAAGDTDWFAVDVAVGETLDATVELTDTRSLGYVGDNDVDLDIYAPDGEEVGENPENVATNNAPADRTSRFDGRFEVTQRTVAEESGTYYVRVAGVDTTGFTSYDLTTSVTGTSSDDSNGNDDGERGTGDEGSTGLGNATAVDSPSAIGNGRIDTDGNADIYAFEMREGSQVELMQGVGGGAYPVTVLDENGAVLGRIEDQGTYNGEEDLLRSNASDTGTYYLKVDGAPGDRYSILGSVTEPDANEPNDGRETATEIGAGADDRGTIVHGDVDYYAVQLDAGEATDVFANSTAAAALTVYGPSGSAIDSQEVPSRFDETTGRPVTSVTAAEGGTYYLELTVQSNAIGRVGGEYAIELTSAGEATGESDDGTPAEAEPNDGETNGDGSDDDGEQTASGSNGTEKASDESITPEPTEQVAGETTTSGTEPDDTTSSNPTTGANSTSNASNGTSGADDATTETATNGGETTDGEQATDSNDVTSSETTAEATTGDAPEDAASEGDTAGDDGTSIEGGAVADDTSATGDASPGADEAARGETPNDDDLATGDGVTTADTAGSPSTTEDALGGTAPSGGAEKTAVDGPGFGLLAALLAVFGIEAFAARRD